MGPGRWRYASLSSWHVTVGPFGLRADAASRAPVLAKLAQSPSRWIPLAAEVRLDHSEAGLDQPSAINCDGLHTIPQTSLTTHVGKVGNETMRNVCSAVAYAIGC